MVWRSQGFESFPAPAGFRQVPPDGGGNGGGGDGQQTPPGVENGAPPSSYAVVSLLDGEPGAIIRMTGLTLLRGCFIVPGLWVSSKIMRVQMEPLELLGLSFAGSGTITLGMIGYYAIRRATG